MKRQKKSKSILRLLLSLIIVTSMLTGNFAGVQLELFAPKLQAAVEDDSSYVIYTSSIPETVTTNFAGNSPYFETQKQLYKSALSGVYPIQFVTYPTDIVASYKVGSFGYNSGSNPSYYVNKSVQFNRDYYANYNTDYYPSLNTLLTYNIANGAYPIENCGEYHYHVKKTFDIIWYAYGVYTGSNSVSWEEEWTKEDPDDYDKDILISTTSASSTSSYTQVPLKLKYSDQLVTDFNTALSTSDFAKLVQMYADLKNANAPLPSEMIEILFVRQSGKTIDCYASYVNIRDKYINICNSISDKLLVQSIIEESELPSNWKNALLETLNNRMLTLGSSIIPSVTTQNTATSVYGQSSNIAITVNNSDTSSQFTVVKPDGTSVKVTAPATVYYPVTKNGTYTFYTTSPTGQTVTTPITVTSYRDTPKVSITPTTANYSSSGVEYIINATCADEILSVSVVGPDGKKTVIGKSSGTFTATANGSYYVIVETEYNTYTNTNANYRFTVSLVFPSANSGYALTQYQVLNYANYQTSVSTQGSKVATSTIGFYITPTSYAYSVHCDTTNKALVNNGSSYYLMTATKNQTYDFTITDPTGTVVNRSITVSDIQESPVLTTSYTLNSKATEATISLTSTGTSSTSKIYKNPSATSSVSDGAIIGANTANYTVTDNGTYYFTILNENGTYYKATITVNGIISEVSVSANLKHVLTSGTEINNTDTTTLAYATSAEIKPTYILGTINSAGSASEYTVTGPNSESITLTNLKTFTYPISGNGTYTFTIKHKLGDTRSFSYGVTNYTAKAVEGSLSHIDKDGQVLSSSDILSFTSESERPTTYIKGSINSSGDASQYKVTGPNATALTVDTDKTFSYPITDNGVYTFTITSSIGSAQTYSMNISNYNNTTPTITLQHVTSTNDLLTNAQYLTYTGISEILTTYIKATVSSGGNSEDYTLTGPNSETITLEGDKTYLYPITENGTYSFTVTSSSGKAATKQYIVSNYKSTKPALTLELVDSSGNSISTSTPINYAGLSEKVTTYIKGTITTGGNKSDYTVTSPTSQTLTLTEDKTFLYPINDNGTYTFVIESSTDTVLQKSYIVNNYKLAPPTVELTQVDSEGTILDSEVPLVYTGQSEKPTTYIKGIITSTGEVADYTILSPTYEEVTLNSDKTFLFPVTQNGTYSFTITSTTESTIVKTYYIKNYKQITPTYTLSQVDSDDQVLSDTSIQDFTDASNVKTTYIKGQITSGGLPEDYTVIGPLSDVVTIEDDLSFKYPIVGNGIYTFKVQTDSSHLNTQNIKVVNYRSTPNVSIIPSTTAITDKQITLSINAICQDEVTALSVTTPSGTENTLGKTSGSCLVSENGDYIITVKTNHNTSNTFTKTYNVSNIIDSVTVDCQIENEVVPYEVFQNTEEELDAAGLSQATNMHVERVKVTMDFEPVEDVANNPLSYVVSAEHLKGTTEVVNGRYEEYIEENGTYIYNILLPTGEIIVKTVTVSTIQPIPELDVDYNVDSSTNKASVYISATSADTLLKVVNEQGKTLGNADGITLEIKSNGRYTFTAYGKNGAYVSKVIIINTIPDRPTITINATDIGEPVNTVKVYPTIETIYGVQSVTLPNGEMILYDKEGADIYELTDAYYDITANGTFTYIIEDTNGSIYYQDIIIDYISNKPTITTTLSEEDWVNEVPITLTVDVKDNTGKGLQMVRISRTYEGETTNKIIRNYKPGTSPNVYNEDISVDRNALYTIEVWDGTQTLDDEPSVVKKRVINIDTESPTLRVSTDASSSDWYRSTTYLLEAEDNYGIKTIECDNGAFIYNEDQGELEFSQNGTYNITAYDWAGNASETKTVNIDHIDNGEPTINIIQDSYGNIQTPVVLKLSFFNAVSPLKEITLPDGNVVDISKQAKNLYKTTYTVPDNGLYEFGISNMTDYTALASVLISTVDRNAPTIKLTPSTTEWTKDNVVLAIDTYDKEGSVSLALPDGTITPNTTMMTYTVTQNGTYKFMVTDRAGNITEASIKISNIVNSKPLQPTITRNGSSLKLESALPICGLAGYTLTYKELLATGDGQAKTIEDTFTTPILPTESKTNFTGTIDLSQLNLSIASNYQIDVILKDSIGQSSDVSSIAYMYIPSAESLDSLLEDKLSQSPTVETAKDNLDLILSILGSMDKDDPLYAGIEELARKYLEEYFNKTYTEIFNKNTVSTTEELNPYLDKINEVIQSTSKYSDSLNEEYTNLQTLKALLESYANAVTYDTTKSLDQILKDIAYLQNLKANNSNLDVDSILSRYTELIATNMSTSIQDILDAYKGALQDTDTVSSEQLALLTKQFADMIGKYSSVFGDDSKDAMTKIIQSFYKELDSQMIKEFETLVADGLNQDDMAKYLDKLLSYLMVNKEYANSDIVKTIMDTIKSQIASLNSSTSTIEDYYDALRYITSLTPYKDFLSAEDLSALAKYKVSLEEIIKALLASQIPTDTSSLDQYFKDLEEQLRKNGIIDAPNIIIQVIKEYITDIKDNPKDNLDKLAQLESSLKDLLAKQDLTDALKEEIAKLQQQIATLKGLASTGSTTGNTGTTGGSGGGGGGGSTAKDTTTQNTTSAVTHKVKVTIEQNYINAVKTYSVELGKTFTLPLSIPDGYTITEVLINNQIVKITDNTVIIPSVTSFQDIYVKVDPKNVLGETYYKITPTVLGSGTLNYSTTFSVAKGETVTLSATPDFGYKISGIYVNNVYMETSQAQYIFKNISKDIKLEVIFEKKEGISTTGTATKHTLNFIVNSDNLTMDNRSVKMIAPVQLANDMPYIPMNTILTLLNVPAENVSWNASEKTLVMYIDSNVYKVKVGSTDIIVNGESKEVSHAAGLLDQRLVVPLTMLKPLLTECTPKTTWNSETNEITIELLDYGYPTITNLEYNSYF